MKNKALLLFLMFTIQALSQSGTIDATFGNNGKVITGFGTNHNFARAIAFQPDGKFLVGGTAISSHGENDFALARYNSDGSLDMDFGVYGKAVTNFLEVNSEQNYIHSIYVLPNGKIVVFGTIGIGGGLSFTGAIVRYNANGTIDTSFGTNGKIISELFCYDRYGSKLIFQPDGKFILTAVKSYINAPDNIGIMRYTEDGILDPTFGTNGQIATSFGSGRSAPCSIALKPDGKFVIAGGYTATNTGQMAVAQYNPDGTPDTSFDTDGKVITTFGPGTNGQAMQLSIAPDGKIKVAGLVGTTVTNFALVQYNANGSLDTTFDGDGKVFSPMPQSESIFTLINSIAAQPDGKYLVLLNPNPTSPPSDFIIRRYNGDASIDTTFGNDGRVATPFDTGFNEAQTAAVAPNGKIVVVGKSEPANLSYINFAVARYNNDGSPDTTLDGDGKLTTAFEKADDQAAHLLVQPDDKIITIGTSAYRQQNNAYFRSVVLSRYNSDGSPDITFGNSGKVAPAFGESVNLVIAAALQPDGKIVLCNAYVFFPNPSYSYELIRYNANGSLDTTFGSGGKVAVNYYPNSIAFQPDGKMIVVGGTIGAVSEFIIWRYNNNGAVDTSFNTDGQLLVSFGQPAFGNPSVLLQPDGKIIFSGSTTNPESATGSFATARFNPDGSPDLSFGNSGQTITPIASTCNSLKAFVQADGKIVVAGTSDALSFSTARYHSNGTIDSSYGTAGISTTNLNVDTYYAINAIQLQADGKFLLALTQYGQSPFGYDFKVKRINPDATFDDSFGGQNGVSASFHNGYDEAFAMGLQSDDKIIVAGSTHNGITNDFALTRLNNTVLGVDDFDNDASNLVIYPNPVGNSFRIRPTAGNGIEVRGYRIYNMLGQVVCQNAGLDLEVQTVNFAKGIYNIVIDTNKGAVTKKFIKA